MQPTHPILYSYRRCPYAMRARMALKQAHIDCLIKSISLKDKPSDLKRYEEKLKQATFHYNRAEGYSSKGKHSTAKTFYNKSESLCEDALEIVQEILHYDSSLRV